MMMRPLLRMRFPSSYSPSLLMGSCVVLLFFVSISMAVSYTPLSHKNNNGLSDQISSKYLTNSRGSGRIPGEYLSPGAGIGGSSYYQLYQPGWDTYLPSYFWKRAPSAAWFGMRGKKVPNSNFFGMRGKKGPSGFLGMRGKKMDGIAGIKESNGDGENEDLYSPEELRKGGEEILPNFLLSSSGYGRRPSTMEEHEVDTVENSNNNN